MSAARTPTNPSALSRDGEFVTTLARGLEVIRAFSREAPEMTLSEVAGRTGLTRATSRRFLLTLERLGYVCTDGKRFRLAPRILELGFAYLSSVDIWNAAMPHMEAVSAETGESCSACVIDGFDIVYVARVPARRVMSVSLNLGARLPAIATALGRVLLANLPPDKARERVMTCPHRAYTRHTVTDRNMLWRIICQAREDGYALVDQELEEGLRSVAVPLRGKSGRVVAAMNLSGHSDRVSVAQIRSRHLPILRDAASRIAHSLIG
jgi:IclR family transcriptional regulator, pca regulon regulatory protein